MCSLPPSKKKVTWAYFSVSAIRNCLILLLAIISPSAIATAVIANIYADNDKNKVLQFINDYNSQNNLEELFGEYKINPEIKLKFFEVFNDGEYPIIKLIGEDNYDEILKESVYMRNNIRGEDIGGLG